MKALSIGHSTYDIYSMVEKYPEESSETCLKDYSEGGGSFATNSAYLLGKYGVDSYIGSVVGDDSYGSFIKKDLDSIGVHTEYMETSYGKRTPYNIVLNNKINGLRTVLGFNKEDLFLKKTEFQMEPDIVITDGYDYGATLAAFNKYPNAITVIKASKYTAEMIELCKSAKYIVASKAFAESFSGSRISFENPQSLVTVFTALINKFQNKTIVVMLEDKGTLYTINGQIKVMPGLQAKAIDVTGSDDIYTSAFAFGLIQNYDLEKTITFANIACGISITREGSHNSIPPLSDVMTYFNQKYNNQMK